MTCLQYVKIVVVKKVIELELVQRTQYSQVGA